MHRESNPCFVNCLLYMECVRPYLGVSVMKGACFAKSLDLLLGAHMHAYSGSSLSVFRGSIHV